MLLRVTDSAGTKICAFGRLRLRSELRRIVELSAESALLFHDSRGRVRRFELRSAYSPDARFLQLSVRLGPTYAVQVDGLLAPTPDDAQAEFAAGRVRGLRLQPFFLPESPAEPDSFVGQGLFGRGLHFSGRVTPGNVSLLCVCDACQHCFRVQSFHAGYSDCAYLYCSGGPHTLIATGAVTDAPPPLGTPDPESLRRFEQRLPPCRRCGGAFAYLNPFRCPACSAPYIDFATRPAMRPTEYYGNCIYGETAQVLHPTETAA